MYKQNTVNAKSEKRFLKSVLLVALSNFVKLLAGVLVGFLLPKIIGVTDYGYYKTFTLYSTYIGLFHFGIEDGIYLKYGGKDYNQLDKEKLRFYSSFLIILEGIISFAFFISFFLSLSGDLRFIFCCLAVTLFATNITNYYQLISQITQRFKELSVITVIQAILTSVAVVILWLLHRYLNQTITYKIYTIIYIDIYYILTAWYLVTYRKITFGHKVRFYDHKSDIFDFFKLGFPLLISNLCSSLILTIDRQFVNILFSTDVYAIYAFSYNLLTLSTTAISAISTVLYPAMKRTDIKELKSQYSKMISAILIISFSLMLLYFPLCFFVKWFLPKYYDSLIVFRVIFPSLAISSCVTIVMQNYYKALSKNISFFVKSLIILVLSMLSDFIAYFCFKTTISISIASIIVMLIWYSITDSYLVKEFKSKWLRNYLYLIISMLYFYLITFVSNEFIGFGIHIILFLTITFCFFYKAIMKKYISIHRKNKLLKGIRGKKINL